MDKINNLFKIERHLSADYRWTSDFACEAAFTSFREAGRVNEGKKSRRRANSGI